jgi:hypothetical protein
MTEMPPRQASGPLKHHYRGPFTASVALASAKGNHVAVSETPPEVGDSLACPDCGMEMVIIRIKPILFGWKFEDLTLACKKCGSTKELRIKRS